MSIDNRDTSFFKNLIIYLGGVFFNLLSLLFLEGEFKEITLLLLLINIIPIYPLDGYKILKTIISYFIPFKYSLIIVNIVSLSMLLISFIFLIPNLDYLLLFNLLFIAILNLKELKNINYSYQSFILNRYLKHSNYKFRRIKFRYNNWDYLYRYHKIYTKVADKRIEEADILDVKYR